MMQQQALPPGMNGMSMGMPQSGNRAYNMRGGQPSYPQMEHANIRPGMNGAGSYNRGRMDGQHHMQQMGGNMNNMHGQPSSYMNPAMGQNAYQNTRGYYNDGGQRNNVMGNGDPRNQMQGNMMGKSNLGGRMDNRGINGFNNGGMDGGFNNSDFPAIGGGMMNQNGSMGVNSYQNALQHMPAPQQPKPEFNMDEEDFPTLGGPTKKGDNKSSSLNAQRGNSNVSNETKRDPQQVRQRQRQPSQVQPNQQQYQQDSNRECRRCRISNANAVSNNNVCQTVKANVSNRSRTSAWCSNR